jgi:hypothetical protein
MLQINPTSLSNRELVEYAERHFYKNGLPTEWQLELIKRFNSIINN